MKKTAIVTGGSRGIGFACARQLGRDGYSVVVMDLNREEDYRESLMLLEEDNTEYM